MSPRTLLYLSREDVERVDLPMAVLIDSVEAVLREKGEGRTEMPPKPAVHPAPDAFLHAMPASIPGLKSAGIKWISAYPQNAAKGLPCIAGLIVLNDPETGMPMAVMDATWVTAKRTMSMNLGLAIEDMATAIRVYQQAVDMGLGTQLPL